MDTRKRRLEDESCEFMPLSKRINNLHIHNKELGRPQVCHINHMDSHREIVIPHVAAAPPSREMHYDPGASASTSLYFTDNKLLFDLHIERLRRNGQLPY